MMQLNTLQPAVGSKSARHRVGRGVGSGWGKTAGRGHSTRWASKAVKCRCIVACRSVVSRL